MIDVLLDLLFCFTMLVCIVNGHNMLLAFVGKSFRVAHLDYVVLLYLSIMYQVYFWFTHFNVI